MEISDYARTKRRWIAPLVAVPLLTGGITAAVLANQPPEFTATVQIQTPSGDAGSDSRIGLYTANLNQAVLVGSVLQDVSRRTGVGIQDLAGTTVNRIQKSDQLGLVLTSTTGPDQTLDAARQLTQAGMLRLLGPAAADPDQAVKSASAALAEAQADLYGYQQQIGYVPPVASSEGPSASVALGALPADQREEINIREARISSASARLNEAQKSFAALEDAVRGAREGTQVVSAVVGPEPRIRPVIEGAGIAGVLGAMVVIGVAIVPDLFRRSSKRASSADVRDPEPHEPGEAVAIPVPEQEAGRPYAGSALERGEPAGESPNVWPLSPTAAATRPSPRPRPRTAENVDAVSATLPTTASQTTDDGVGATTRIRVPVPAQQ